MMLVSMKLSGSAFNYIAVHIKYGRLKSADAVEKVATYGLSSNGKKSTSQIAYKPLLAIG